MEGKHGFSCLGLSVWFSTFSPHNLCLVSMSQTALALIEK